MWFVKQYLSGLSVLALLFIAFFGIATYFKFHSSKSHTVTPTATAAEAPQVITVGNRSYVPLNLMGGSAANARTILEAIQLFESLHRELHVTSFHVERNCYMASSNWVSNPYEFIVGVWLTHEPR